MISLRKRRFMKIGSKNVNVLWDGGRLIVFIVVFEFLLMWIDQLCPRVKNKHVGLQSLFQTMDIQILFSNPLALLPKWRPWGHACCHPGDQNRCQKGRSRGKTPWPTALTVACPSAVLLRSRLNICEKTLAVFMNSCYKFKDWHSSGQEVTYL